MTTQSASRPRVLYLTKVYPYPPENAGDAVYSRGIIEAIAGTCSVSVLCAQSAAQMPPPKSIDWHIAGPARRGRAGSVLSRWPLIAWKGAQPDYLAQLDQLLAQGGWDAIVLDNLGLAHALPRAEAYRRANPGTKLIYVSHEYEYPTRAGKYGSYSMSLPKRTMANWDLQKVKRSEEALIRSCDLVTVINTADVAPFKKISDQVKYLPLIPGYDGPVLQSRQLDQKLPRRALLLGGRRSEQKQQILLDWMEKSYEPLCAAGVEMVIVGDMPDALQATLAQRYPQTQVMGFVDDLNALIGSARMGIIADTVGGGFKMRLLSHVFQRLPIVGLSGAISGLPTPEGEGYLGVSDLDKLVGVVQQSIDDLPLLNGIQNKAFEDCLPRFSWQSRAQSLAMHIRGDTGNLM